MLQAEWDDLSTQLHTLSDVHRLSTTTPFSYETLFAVYESLYTTYQIRNSYLIRDHATLFVEMYDAGTSLLDIAMWIKMPPVLIARKVLERKENAKGKVLTRFIKSPMLIEDPRLRHDVEVCINSDETCGPWHDKRRNAMGLIYEQLLIDEIRALGLQFECESQLRERQCFRTPDVLLRIPVLFCGNLVHWIDSKAKFADEVTLNRDYAGSLQSYVNRFGPGMVIYWFGFVEDVQSKMHQDGNIFITDTFQRNVQMLKGSTLAELKDIDYSTDEDQTEPHNHMNAQNGGQQEESPS